MRRLKEITLIALCSFILFIFVFILFSVCSPKIAAQSDSITRYQTMMRWIAKGDQHMLKADKCSSFMSPQTKIAETQSAIACYMRAELSNKI